MTLFHELLSLKHREFFKRFMKITLQHIEEDLNSWVICKIRQPQLRKLLDEKYILEIDNSSNKKFISPIVITVNSDESADVTTDSKILNNSIHRNKYQKPIIKSL